MDRDILVIYLALICGIAGYYYGRSSQKRESESWNLQRRLMDVEYRVANPSSQEAKTK